MKITKVECIPVTLPYKKPMKIGKHTSPAANSIVVKIYTDEGITGIGESGHGGIGYTGDNQDSIISVIKENYAPAALLGEDPFNIEKIVARMEKAAKYSYQAMAVVDYALHDVVGKALGVPVYKLLGGLSNEKIRLGFVIGFGTPQEMAAVAGFSIHEDRKFIIVKEDRIGKQYHFSSEKLTTVLAIFKYSGFDNALEMVRQIYEVGGKGHSCGIYSFNDDHIHRLAMVAPVSRMMVRQPQSKANAGSFTNGMPMTSSLGCGIWGGNITNENIHLKHYMNVTWVARPIPEDRPSEAELFGEFYNTETL